jgi:hypothetical protein
MDDYTVIVEGKQLAMFPVGLRRRSQERTNVTQDRREKPQVSVGGNKKSYC